MNRYIVEWCSHHGTEEPLCVRSLVKASSPEEAAVKILQERSRVFRLSQSMITILGVYPFPYPV
ncbi:hypothetical protein ACFYKX_10610 [Cytobacillus sp. FJAT-54145]|uniref:Uncharacterized protein n=1 Tax=Cytobacillus spartinae TaxID=3299023 RepID=A0ABW6KE23_9BACI